jgi:diadenosine tetraphosphatase ApaH/serine/threonine PP2A family protein phosphatase
MHGRPETPWRAPGAEASDAELASVYGALARPMAVYAHIHRPFVRSIAGGTVANSASVGLSQDGDQRAAYLLVDDSGAEIRRVDYDIDRELTALTHCGLPHASWVARMLRSASAQMP